MIPRYIIWSNCFFSSQLLSAATLLLKWNLVYHMNSGNGNPKENLFSELFPANYPVQNTWQEAFREVPATLVVGTSHSLLRPDQHARIF